MQSEASLKQSLLGGKAADQRIFIARIFIVILMILAGSCLILLGVAAIYSPLEERLTSEGEIISNVRFDTTTKLEFTLWFFMGFNVFTMLALLFSGDKFGNLVVALALSILVIGNLVLFIMQLVVNYAYANKLPGEGGAYYNPAQDLTWCCSPDVIADPEFYNLPCPNNAIAVDCGVTPSNCFCTKSPGLEVSLLGHDKLGIYWAWIMRIVAQAVLTAIQVAVIILSLIMLYTQRSEFETLFKNLNLFAGNNIGARPMRKNRKKNRKSSKHFNYSKKPEYQKRTRNQPSMYNDF